MKIKPGYASVSRWASLSILMLTMMVAPKHAQGQSSKLAPELTNIPAGQKVNVIVQYNSRPSVGLLTAVLNLGGTLLQDLSLLNESAFQVPGSALNAIVSNSNVVYVSLDRPVQSHGYSNNPDFYEDAVFAQSAWNQYDGAGIGIALIDSGIGGALGSNPDLLGRVVYSQSFVPGEWWTNDPYGHGTHVAGILAGSGASSTGWNYSKTFMGVANGANLINLRVLDENGAGTDSSVIAAIQTAIQLKYLLNIRVINLSVGRGVFESYTQDPLCQAVEAAWKAGIVVVVAAGNDGRDNAAGTNGYGTINAPGNDPYVITVGAMKPMGTPDRSDDLIASYSSKGPTLFDHIVKPDIVAPGNLVISLLSSPNAALFSSANAVPTYYYNNYGNNKASTAYYKMNGTSMATPVVAGAAALLLQQNGALTPDQVKARLMKTSYKTFPRYSTATDPGTGQTYTSQYDAFTVGAGYLDIQNAMHNTDLAPSTVGSAISPAVAEDSSGNVYMVTSQSVIWGNSTTWGTSQVWGSSIWANTSTVQGEHVLWGSSAVSSSSVLWGDHVLWGTKVLWGTSDPTAQSVQLQGEQ
jgi:serine protease AprX